MTSAERVVNVQIAQFGQCAGKARIPLLLSRVEAEVFQEQHFLGPKS